MSDICFWILLIYVFILACFYDGMNWHSAAAEVESGIRSDESFKIFDRDLWIDYFKILILSYLFFAERRSYLIFDWSTFSSRTPALYFYCILFSAYKRIDSGTASKWVAVMCNDVDCVKSNTKKTKANSPKLILLKNIEFKIL